MHTPRMRFHPKHKGDKVPRIFPTWGDRETHFLSGGQDCGPWGRLAPRLLLVSIHSSAGGSRVKQCYGSSIQLLDYVQEKCFNPCAISLVHLLLVLTWLYGNPFSISETLYSLCCLIFNLADSCSVTLLPCLPVIWFSGSWQAVGSRVGLTGRE